MLGEALGAAAVRNGWEVRSLPGEGDAVVTDRLLARHRSTSGGQRVVLVCEPTPHGARVALSAVAALMAAAVVCADDPADLVAALEGLTAGRVSIPLRVVDLAGQMPELTERQLAVLGAVAAGQSNGAIGRGLYLSAASVKRELAALYSAIGVTSRPSLAASAQVLGVPVHDVLP